MKKQILVTMLFTTLLLFSCTKIQEKTAKEVLEAPKLRLEIFDEILNNGHYLSEFTDKMTTSEKGRDACVTNLPLMKMAWESNKMDSMINVDQMMMETMINRVVRKMEKDTGTCSMMCSKVMENEHLKSYVMKHACASTEKRKSK